MSEGLAKARTPLFTELLPELRSLPFLPLLHGPTPALEARALTPWLGRDNVWVKRDDLASPIYGGNKIRKYELLMADAKARGARSLFTIGALASTQVTATALIGRALGYPVTAVLFDQPLTDFGRHALLANLAAGATLVHGGNLPMTALRALDLWPAAQEAGAYFVWPGSSTPLPNLGFIDAALELAAQHAAGEIPYPDVVIAPAGTCGTIVGLALGFRLLGMHTEVIGVRITSAVTCNPLYVCAVAGLTDRWLRQRSPTYDRLANGRMNARIFHGAAGPGYGEPTKEAWEGAARLADVTGHEGEITYSGKALAALKMLAKDPRYAKKSLVLWNTLTHERPSIAGVTPDDLPPRLRAIYRGDTVKVLPAARTQDAENAARGAKS